MAALFSLTSLIPAQAQQPTPHSWNITYNTSGTTTYAIPDSPVQGQSTPQSSPFGGSQGQNEIDIQTSGTVTATLTWVPATGQTTQSDPPPEPVYIREVGYALEDPWQWYGPGSLQPGTADDGLGDVPVPFDQYGLVSSGTHLVQRDGSSGTIVLGPFTVKAAFPTSHWLDDPNAPGHPHWDLFGGLCMAYDVPVSVIPDNRAVTISSPIETSYYKYTGTSQNGTSNQWAHQRDPITGAMVVDSAVAWQTAFGGGVGLFGSAHNQGWQVSNVPLTATPINFYSYPTYSWKLSGLTLPEAWLTSPTANPTDFSLIEADSSKFPLHGTVTVNATDSDGAIASNFYDMTWHLPIETHALTSSTRNPKERIDGPLSPDPCYPGLPPLQNRASPEGDINIGAGIEGLGAFLAATGQEEFAGFAEIIGKLVDAVDLKYHYGGEPAKSYTNNQDLWNTCVQTSAQAAHNVDDPNLLTRKDDTGRLNGFEFTTMQVFIYKYTIHKAWNADFYNFHGYNHDGTVYADVLDQPNAIKPEPYYTTQNQHN